ncbi:Alkyldihydroxyacetonephosphate synthase [Parelaphostrongylus tenuis]|nr:Alkyldihydroxyacetonephosphate synthase [Parelaphostrongylus tenuis]
MSSGPDLHHIIMGSEGTLGVVTEVTIKIFPLPEVKRYGSLVLPDFAHGVAFFREVARQRIQPASLRLVDNEQFIMGQALKLEVNSYCAALKSSLSRLYITKWKGFHIDEMCAATCVFEGSLDEVNNEERRLYALAEEYNGVFGGEENGKYGYRLTFAIAYLRVLSLCQNVKTLIKRLAKNLRVQYPVLASCRVTQVYDAGACVYFYFGFNTRGLHNGLEVYDKIETAARDEIIACGGSISHHHGIGKLRKQCNNSKDRLS